MVTSISTIHHLVPEVDFKRVEGLRSKTMMRYKITNSGTCETLLN